MSSFLLSEDIGAEPLPVVNCGLACQFKSREVVPLEELDAYVQDALDLSGVRPTAIPRLHGAGCAPRWGIPSRSD